MQFPIAEPIGFAYEQQFTELVKATVQMERHMSPEIAFDFNPLPSGKFHLNRLQVLDNFGVSTTIPTNYVVPFAEPLCDANVEIRCAASCSWSPLTSSTWSSFFADSSVSNFFKAKNNPK